MSSAGRAWGRGPAAGGQDTTTRRRKAFLADVQGPEFASPIRGLFGDRRLAVIDTEYTGTLPFEIAVTAFGTQPCTFDDDTLDCEKCWGFGFPDSWLIDPEAPINAFARRATGVADRDVSGAGNFAVHAPRLLRWLRSSEGAYLIGWNVGGDKNYLEKALRKAGLSYGAMHWIDLARMFHQLHPEVGDSGNETKICRLSEAAEHYAIAFPAEQQHLAFYDVLTTCRLLSRVCDEWLAADLSERNIAVSGFYGNGWDPRADRLIAPIRWRDVGQAQALAIELEWRFMRSHGGI